MLVLCQHIGQTWTTGQAMTATDPVGLIMDALEVGERRARQLIADLEQSGNWRTIRHHQRREIVALEMTATLWFPMPFCPIALLPNYTACVWFDLIKTAALTARRANAGKFRTPGQADDWKLTADRPHLEASASGIDARTTRKHLDRIKALPMVTLDAGVWSFDYLITATAYRGHPIDVDELTERAELDRGRLIATVASEARATTAPVAPRKIPRKRFAPHIETQETTTKPVDNSTPTDCPKRPGSEQQQRNRNRAARIINRTLQRLDHRMLVDVASMPGLTADRVARILAEDHPETLDALDPGRLFNQLATDLNPWTGIGKPPPDRITAPNGWLAHRIAGVTRIGHPPGMARHDDEPIPDYRTGPPSRADLERHRQAQHIAATASHDNGPEPDRDRNLAGLRKAREALNR